MVSLAVTAAVGVVGGLPTPAAAQILPSPCDFAPSGPFQDACDATVGAVTDPVGAVGAVAGLAGDGLSAVGIDPPAFLTDPVGWLASLLADTVNSAMGDLGKVLSSAPEPPIDQAWFDLEYKPLMRAGMFLCLIVAAVYFLWFGFKGHLWDLGRSFQMFLLAIFLTATAPLFIRMALRMADGLSAGLASRGGDYATELTTKIGEVTKTITATGGLGDVVKPVILIIVLFVCVVLVVIWMVLLAVRSMLIYVGTLAVPFVLPSIIDGKARFARIYGKAMFGLIIAKPVLVGTVVSGAWLLERGYVEGDGFQAMLIGLAIFLVATVVPWFVMKLLGLATPVVVAVERGASRVAHTAKAGAAAAVGFVGGSFAGAATAAGAANAATPRTPPPEPRYDPGGQPPPRRRPLKEPLPHLAYAGPDPAPPPPGSR
jgi:hypothetical protein